MPEFRFPQREPFKTPFYFFSYRHKKTGHITQPCSASTLYFYSRRLLYWPMISSCARMCPRIALSSIGFDVCLPNISLVSSAYTAKW